MNREQAFRLQSYADGELSRREADGVRDWISQSPDAQRMLREIQWARAVVSENEPLASVPESREFYWGKIERAIELEAAGRQRAPRAGRWLEMLGGIRRLLAPSAGLALAMILVVGVVKFYEVPVSVLAPRHVAQIEIPSEDMGYFSFLSLADNVFVVWLYDRSAHLNPSQELLNTMVIQ
jgi:hypothetical protein